MGQVLTQHGQVQKGFLPVFCCKILLKSVHMKILLESGLTPLHSLQSASIDHLQSLNSDEIPLS